MNREEYGLVGFPLVHSFSRRYFTERFDREGRDAQYLNFEMESVAALPDVVAAHPNLRGLNVTIPHKQAVMPYLSSLSAAARAIGAVNVIRIERKADGQTALHGYNSDVIGFCDSIRPLLKPHHKRALVLGTGGASKAICYGLSQLGLDHVNVSRSARPGMLAYADLDAGVMADCTVIVNCSPVGTFPHDDECPAIPYHLLTQRHMLYDLVYNPEKTLFLRNGEAQGAAIKNGLEMLHRQAEASWDFWHDADTE